MTRIEALNQIKKVCISQCESTGLFYVEPDWKHYLRHAFEEEPFELLEMNMDDVYQYLRLESKRLNKFYDGVPELVEKVNALLQNVIEPAIADAVNAEVEKNL